MIFLQISKLYTQQAPFPDAIRIPQMISKLIKQSKPKRPSQKTHAKKGFWKFIEKCWKTNPAKRPSASDLVISLPLAKPILELHGSEIPSHLAHTTIDPCKIIFAIFYFLLEITIVANIANNKIKLKTINKIAS